MGTGVEPDSRTLASGPSALSAPSSPSTQQNGHDATVGAVAPDGARTVASGVLAPVKHKPHIAYLDGLRALAVIAIFLRHAGGSPVLRASRSSAWT